MIDKNVFTIFTDLEKASVTVLKKLKLVENLEVNTIVEIRSNRLIGETTREQMYNLFKESVSEIPITVNTIYMQDINKARFLSLFSSKTLTLHKDRRLTKADIGHFKLFFKRNPEVLVKISLDTVRNVNKLYEHKNTLKILSTVSRCNMRVLNLDRGERLSDQDTNLLKGIRFKTITGICLYDITQLSTRLDEVRVKANDNLSLLQKLLKSVPQVTVTIHSLKKGLENHVLLLYLTEKQGYKTTFDLVLNYSEISVYNKYGKKYSKDKLKFILCNLRKRFQIRKHRANELFAYILKQHDNRANIWDQSLFVVIE